MISPTRCQNRSWNAERLESIVWEQVRNVLLNPELVIAEAQRI
jgi:hypothetical protein